MNIKRFLIPTLVFLGIFNILNLMVKNHSSISEKIDPYKKLDNTLFLTQQIGDYGKYVVFNQNGQLFVNRHPADYPDFFYKIYDYIPPKETGEFRIVFFGNSQVYEVISDNRIPIPFMVENILRQKFPNKKIRVFNFSCFGMGTSELLITVIKSIITTKPDLVVLAITPRDLFNEQSKSIGITPEYSPPILDYSVSVKLLKQHFLLLKTGQYQLSLQSFAQYYKVWQRDTNKKLNDFVVRVWPTYNSRTIFSQRITETLFSLSGISAHTEEIKKSEVRIPLAENPYYENEIFPNSRSFQYEMLLNFLSKEIPKNVLIYNEPVRLKTANLYYSPATFEKRVSFLKKEAENNNIEFIDFYGTLPDADFQDWIHLEPQGVETLSKMIVEKITNKYHTEFK